MHAMSMQRFYMRYAEGGLFSLQNKTYYDKLIASSQFTKDLFTSMQKLIGVDSSGDDGTESVDRSKNLYLSYEQYSNCVRDTDTTTNAPPKVLVLKYPKARADRCISGYNTRTKELVIQYLPILEDRFYVRDVFDLINNTTTDAMAVSFGQRYHQWFFDKVMELSTFLGHSTNPLPGCKHHIFSIFVENDELKKDNSDISLWTIDNAPLFYLHVKFTGSKNKSATLDAIEIKLHNNCQILGFYLYGNAEALHSLERFYTEFKTYFDELQAAKVPSSKHHLRPLAQGSFLKAGLGGQWFKSKSAMGNDAKFAAGWSEFMYKVVDLYDEKDLWAKVRTKYYRDRLKTEAKGQLDRVIAWNNTNKHAVGLKFDATSHRAQLVYKPVSRANLLDSNDWTERASDFGLDKLTNLQSFGLLTYTLMLNELHEAKTFVHRATSYFGTVVNKFTDVIVPYVNKTTSLAVHSVIDCKFLAAWAVRRESAELLVISQRKSISEFTFV